MSMTVVLGIDVGTTASKATAYDLDGAVVGHATVTTRWDVGSLGETQADAQRMADDAIAALAAAVPEGVGRVAGIGITGMAETGVLVTPQGDPLMPAMAWFDERGKQDLAALPEEFRQEFSAVTGLACKAECSFAKLLWRHNRGERIPADARWLNLLEFVAFRLTGAMATEPSLASRTGLLDQATLRPWAGTLALIEADERLLPPMVPAGLAVGGVAGDNPGRLQGAAVTVAGHDHLVGAVGAGATGTSALYDSCGTADVILRSVPQTLTSEERATLVSRGLSAGRHVISDSTAILGATRSGLVLGRVLSLLGAHDREARRVIADRWMPPASPQASVQVSEPPAWTNEVTVSLHDDVTPDQLWAAAMDYVLGATSTLVHAVDDIAGAYDTAVAAGGWSRLDGVFRGKASVMPGLTRSASDEPGTRGAAMFAARAAGDVDGALVAELPPLLHATPHKELIP